MAYHSRRGAAGSRGGVAASRGPRLGHDAGIARRSQGDVPVPSPRASRRAAHPWTGLLVVCAVLALAPRLARADAPACAGNALVTLEDGAIVNVEWPERTAGELRGRAVTNATLATEYRIALRPDGSVASAATTAHALDGKSVADERQVAAGAVFWSDRLPSTLEQIVLRARAIGAASQAVPLVAASKDVPRQAQVERIDANRSEE